jgi:hypothetical protein
MQITAKLTQLLPIQTGTGKNGEWKKQDIIVETDGQYPKRYASQFGVIRSMRVNCKLVPY